ncbi:hypothetical protein MLD38_005104 [Melastoma candidum]|uniref:Uncharacterized protein n=1 Tax=Melastoma candidum TaxID=119954 RepID=A0ACB9SBP4_9MYRT|nr:hypothetical protein MLD38_005104 [Melastoma candidum]
MGNTIDGVAELAANFDIVVNNLDGAGDVDLAVVEGSLRVRPGSAGGQVPPKCGPCPAYKGFGKDRGCRGIAVGVGDDASGGLELLGEPRGRNHVVVPGFLVGGDEDAVALANVDVKGFIHVLDNVRISTSFIGCP